MNHIVDIIEAAKSEVEERFLLRVLRKLQYWKQWTDAYQEGIGEPILVGDSRLIRIAAQEANNGKGIDDFTISDNRRAR